MDSNPAPRMQDMSAATFDSFYHRRTPRWRNPGALPIAVGSAIALGCVILSATLAILG